MKTNSLTLMLVLVALVQVATPKDGTAGVAVVIGVTKKDDDALFWYVKDNVLEGCLVKQADYPVSANDKQKVKFKAKGQAAFSPEFGVPKFTNLGTKNEVAFPTERENEKNGITDYCQKSGTNGFEDSVRRRVRIAL